MNGSIISRNLLAEIEQQLDFLSRLEPLTKFDFRPLNKAHSLYEFSSNNPEIQETEIIQLFEFHELILAECNEERKFEYLMNLFALWTQAAKSKKTILTLKAVESFGAFFIKYSANDLHYTLTQNGTELRVWYEIPIDFNANHVGSLGRGLFLEITGHPMLVKVYLQGLRQIYPLDGCIMPQGVYFYTRFNNTEVN